MKRTALALLATGLAATWIGCQSATEPSPSSAGSESESATTDLVLVTLDVPNMV